MRPVFCGNLDFDARQSDVERLFRRYGKVDRVDMKSVGMSMLFLDGCASLHFFSRMCPSFSLYFSRRNNLIRPSPAILHFLSIHCFFIPHDFCSVFNFQHVST
uniref:Arginine/serine-rich-splicing factor RSP41 n=1 Tax=Cajanus cajan TaxID=3821 RepID=A0A151UCG8_CAJCA|nr:Arginine/serine-rich-splicing factor RSP41 [Cajanus cajan]